MLETSDLVAFVTTARPEQARAFYADVLGLRLMEDTPFALVFDANGTALRVAIADAVQPAPGTVLGWTVADLAGTIDGLTAAGVTFERFEGMQQDDRGVWATPGGAEVAWFKDPDGNLLSLTRPPA